MCHCIVLQLRLIVYDSAYPNARDTSDVVISVFRDESGPIFQPSATYQITIPETTPIGNEVLDVDAIDPDGVSFIKFSVNSSPVEFRNWLFSVIGLICLLLLWYFLKIYKMGKHSRH